MCAVFDNGRGDGVEDVERDEGYREIILQTEVQEFCSGSKHCGYSNGLGLVVEDRMQGDWHSGNGRGATQRCLLKSTTDPYLYLYEMRPSSRMSIREHSQHRY